MRLWLFAVFASANFVVFGLTGALAGTTGGIQGFVTDTARRPLAGVTVSAVSPSDRIVAVTHANGFFSLNGLPIDTYTITFSKDGYLTRSTLGTTTVPDQSVRVDEQLESGIKTLAQVRVRSSTSLVQPTVTADAYSVSQQQLSDINGTPQDMFGALHALPGVTVDSFGLVTIRAGAFNDVGWQLDGVDNTDPVTGGLLGAGSFNGVHSLQLLTGGYDVSEGNTNSGVINEVIRRGTYPAHGQATMRTNSRIFGHDLSFDLGDATPTNRFSYYFSFGGQREANGSGSGSAFLPLTLNGNTFGTLNDDVLNLFYRFARDGNDEVQFLANVGGQTFTAGNLIDPAIAPYASNNGVVQAATDFFALGQFSTFGSSYVDLFPGQVAKAQNINAPDTSTFNWFIGKINLKRQLSPSSFLEARIMRTMEKNVNSSPYGGGAFGDAYSNLQTTGTGEAFDYTNQLDSKHEFSVGATGFYYANQFSAESLSPVPFFEPLEALGCQAAANALGVQQAGGCYIAPYDAALNAALGLGLPTDPAHAPLTAYVFNGGAHANDPVHRWDLYVKDRWQPNGRLTMTLGMRWDKESIPIPADAAVQNTTYYMDNTMPVGCGAPPAVPCNIVTVPGRPVGTDVTQPQQISPRIAVSYELSHRDAVRFSFGKNIEFVPLLSIEQQFAPPTSLQSCTISSGCFIPLPGYGTTNHVTNLYQQVLLDLTTHVVEQYTPVLPQTAVNLDFSYEHKFGEGLDLRLTPYYRKGSNYAVGSAPLLFTLPGGTPIFGAPRTLNVGINKNTGVEFVLQRTAQYGLSGLFDLTYDNTLANYDGDFFPGVNSAALAAGHFYHVTYLSPVTGALNLKYSRRSGLSASTTVLYESGYRYGVGKKTFFFDSAGVPTLVLNTDLASGNGVGGAYYLTNPSNPGTVFAPNIVASRGTPEGDDPGTLFGPPIAIINVTLSHTLGTEVRDGEVGMRVENLFGNYSPRTIPPNPYYGFSGFGNQGLPSGVNPNACAPGQTFGCEPFRYNYSSFPYEKEQTGPPRVYTLFFSVKY